MAYTGYYTDQNLRDKLGNTIGANYANSLIDEARRAGDAFVDSETHKPSIYQDSQDGNVMHSWYLTNLYFARAMAISMKYACAFVRSTQLNVSIQEQREWNEACQDVDRLYKDLIAAGEVQKSGRFFTDEYLSDVLNPITGTRVSGLYGIVPGRGSLYGVDVI